MSNDISGVSWHSVVIKNLQSEVKGDLFWERYLENLFTTKPVPYNIHLAVFIEPYLQFILEGKKTVESRFSAIRCAPYGRVGKGDIVVLKRSGGPIVGICQISITWSYKLDPNSWQTIKKDFMQKLCAEDPGFWKSREGASFATLMQIHHVRPVKPMEIQKRDRRGWVILQEASRMPFYHHGNESL